MDQPDLEIQLRAWKELAVSKQVLIRVATEALGLDSECTSDELKKALDDATEQAQAAGARVERAHEQARIAVSVMEKKMADMEQAKTAAETARDKALAAQRSTEERLSEMRSNNSKEQKKLNVQLAEKQKALKAINVALADTPENVVKKLRGLRKEKLDEANERKRAEGDVRSLRKEKQQLDQRVTELKKALEDATKLCEQHRELYKFCEEQRQLLPTSEGDGDDAPPALPELDETLLESIEQAAGGDDDGK